MLAWRVPSCIEHLESLDHAHLCLVGGGAMLDRSSKCLLLRSGAEVDVGDSWDDRNRVLLHCVRTS